MLGPAVLFFTLYLGTMLLARKRPSDAERGGTMCGFCLLVPAMITQELPLVTLSVVALYFVLYVRKTH